MVMDDMRKGLAEMMLPAHAEMTITVQEGTRMVTGEQG